jgi:hypothetical protein
MDDEAIRALMDRLGQRGGFGMGRDEVRVMHPALVREGADLSAVRDWVARHGGVEGVFPAVPSKTLSRSAPHRPPEGYFLIPEAAISD